MAIEQSDKTKDQKVSEKLLQLVSFTLGSEEYGVDILQVQEISSRR